MSELRFRLFPLMYSSMNVVIFGNEGRTTANLLFNVNSSKENNQFPCLVRVFRNAHISQVCLDSLQSPIPKMLPDLSGNQLLCTFQSEVHAFWVICTHNNFQWINNHLLAILQSQTQSLTVNRPLHCITWQILGSFSYELTTTCTHQKAVKMRTSQCQF